MGNKNGSVKAQEPTSQSSEYISSENEEKSPSWIVDEIEEQMRLDGEKCI